MTGDSHSNDDSDFLEDDFIVEDIVGKNDDLEDLFEAPASLQPDSKAKAEDAAAGDPANPDEDDVLFSDHTEGVLPTEEFAKQTFAEDGSTEWDGAELDLESVGVPILDEAGEEAAADPEIAEAEQSFVEELDSLLHDGDDFAIESEDELELVETDADDGISEFEQSGPFVLDDGEGLWSEDLDDAQNDDEIVLVDDDQQPAEVQEFEVEDLPPVAEVDEVDEPKMTTMSAGDQLVADSFAENETVVSMDDSGDDEDEFEDVDNLQLLDAAAGDAGGAGWEPLPARSMDALSDVDEVQRTDEEYDTEGYEEDDDEAGYDDEACYDDETYEGEEYEGATVDGDLEDVEGHDIYGENEDSDRAVVLGGPGSQRGRTRTLLLSLAASILFVGGAATIVVRPEWFGLSVEPEQVAKIHLSRPKVEVAVVEPRLVPLANTVPGSIGAENVSKPEGGGNAGGVDTNNPAGGNPDTPAANPNPFDPGAANPGATPVTVPPKQPSEVMANGGSQPELPTVPSQPEVVPTPAQPIAGAPTPSKTTGTQTTDTQTDGVTDTGTGENSWPVASGKPVVAPKDDKAALVPFGDGLLVGGASGMSAARAIDGVMPGSRAFAQLHNGNYFIGKVKQVAEETITLRLDTGEVTLAKAEITQLTRLGSTDYDELQKATKGFVRLTNNNRLIGGILSKIADDHIVLEFRSNRVMLPKSAIGEIVSGKAEDGKVRLGTTNEEDNWVRTLAERQLGSGQGATSKKKPKAPASSEPPR